MSYCRWSSDDWKCDLYCFADVGGGYTTYVAGKRLVTKLPKNVDLTSENVETWFKVHEKQMNMLESAEYENINLPHAGKSFNDPTLKKFFERIIYLKELGYHIPDYVIDQIMEELDNNKYNEDDPREDR